MAWLEDYRWEIEQGKPGQLEIFLWEDVTRRIPWTFVNWLLEGTVYDEKKETIFDLDLSASEGANGIVNAVLSEANANALKIGKVYRFDILGIAPGSDRTLDDFFVAGTVVPVLRGSRRPQP